MHVLIVCRGIPDKDYPLLGLFEFDQAKALTEAGIQVTYFAIDLRSLRRVRKFGIHKGENTGVKWYRADIPVGAVPKSALLKIGTWALKILYRSVFSNAKPDIIHAHFTESAFMAAKLAEQENIPLVITEHSSEMNIAEINSSLLSYAEYAYRKAAAVIAVSHALARNIKRSTGVACKVVPNVLDEQFLQIRRCPHREPFSFVFTGNLIEGKRPLLLLDAFSELKKNYPNTRLGIIGEGELRAEIEKQIEAKNLRASVKLYGRLPRERMASIYSDYDCFVLPSASETFGVAYIEAMAAGLPVIGTKCGGPEDYVTSSTGIMIPVDDKSALVSAMEQMITNRAQFDSNEIRSYVKNTFSPAVIARELSDIYRAVIE